MEVSEVIFILLVFWVTYQVTNPKKRSEQQLPDKKRSKVMETNLHRIRTQGIDVDRMYDIAGELIRRGVPVNSIPTLGSNGIDTREELQAYLEMMLQETPYVTRDNSTPGEDKALAKSTWQIWARPLEQQNGDN